MILITTHAPLIAPQRNESGKKTPIIQGGQLKNEPDSTYECSIETPWGKPSDNLIICQSEKGVKVAFLARHGRGHYLTPSEVPNLANIAALKSVGCKIIFAFSAVGSLREEIAPRDFVLASQIIDRTKGIRESTFFKDGLVGHVMFGSPFSSELCKITESLFNEIPSHPKLHVDKTLVCMEGPCFSTIAESRLYRQWGGDLINMSVCPEAKLAREAEIPYMMICMVTDYDCWRVAEEHVSVETVIGNMKHNSSFAKVLALKLIEHLGELLSTNQIESVQQLEHSSRHSIMTSKDKRNPAQIEKMRFLLGDDFE